MSDEVEVPGINISPPEAAGFPLTREFLELAFDKKVDTFEAKLGTNPGDNYMSVIHAVEVFFHGEKEPNNYLIKCYPTHQGRRDFLDQIDIFSRELFMYEDFLVQLKQLVTDRGAEKVAGLSVAPFHGGNVVGQPSKFKEEPWCNENFIIMTDLRTTGYKMADRIQGLDLEHTHLVLREVAKLHATSWAYKQKNGLQLLTSKYPKCADNMYSNDTLMNEFQSLMDTLTDNTLKVLEDGIGCDHPAYQSMHKKLKTEMEEFLAFMKKYFLVEGIDEELMETYLRVKPEPDSNYIKAPWLVGNHGDCWVNNMLFRYDTAQATKPIGVTFVDFQIFREVCPTLDLAYFLFSSVRAPIRNANLNDLLKTYYDTFIQCCSVLGVNPLAGFTFENLKRRFRRAELFGVFVAMPILTVVLKPQEESVDLDKTEGTDMAAVFESVMGGADKNKGFRDEMVATVLNLYDRGIL